jgi:hypothetical protein
MRHRNPDTLQVRRNRLVKLSAGKPLGQDWFQVRASPRWVSANQHAAQRSSNPQLIVVATGRIKGNNQPRRAYATRQ